MKIIVHQDRNVFARVCDTPGMYDDVYLGSVYEGKESLLKNLSETYLKKFGKHFVSNKTLARD